MLAGRTNKDWMEGDIFLNRERRKESFRLQCGFVVQVLHENLCCKKPMLSFISMRSTVVEI